MPMGQQFQPVIDQGQFHSASSLSWSIEAYSSD